MSNGTIITPTDQVLSTFNIFENGTLNALASFGTFLNQHSSEYFNKNRNTLVGTSTAEPSAQSNFQENISERASYEKIAGSLGIKGKYGFYSGSLQVQASNSRNTNSTAYSGSYCGKIHKGVVKLNDTNNVPLSYFSKHFRDKIKGINSLQQAKKFIDTFGTHVALGLNLGGAFSLCITSNTSTYTEKTAVKTAVNAAYNGVDESISGVAGATINLNDSGSNYNLLKHHKFFGGNPSDSSLDTNNVDNWIKSCTSGTAYSISESIDMPTLASNNGLINQAKILKDYVDLKILKHSLENPTIFSNHVAMLQSGTVNVTAIADKNYKIVSGGAAISSGSNAQSFLTGSYPRTQSQDNGLLQITGWEATSGGASGNTSNYLTSYAIAVYDPGHHLDVFVSSAGGTNPGSGGDTANSPTWPNVNAAILTGGGCQISLPSGGNAKYMTSSGPKQLNGQWKSWQATVQDYVSPATKANLIGYAIGVGCVNFTISHTVTPQSTGSTQEHANEQAQLNNNRNLIGGGVILGATTAGNGNLLRQSFPSSTNTWTEYNTDWANSNSPCIATAYAIGLTVSINGIEPVD